MKPASKNFVLNLIYQLFILIMPLITSPYVSRLFGPSGIGTYSFYFSIATYFTYFELLGINNYGVRNIAKCCNQEERNKAFSEIYGAQLIVSSIVLIAYLFYCVCFVGQNQLIAICFLPYVFSSAIDINWYFFGTEQFAKTTIRNCIIKSITIIAVFVFVKQQSDIFLYVLIISLGYLACQIVMWVVAFKQIRIRKVNFRVYFVHIKGLILLFIPVLAISLYRIMDKIMLGLLTNMNEVGYYESAEKIIGVPGAVITALGISMLPRMTNLITSGEIDQAKKNISESTYFVGFIMFAMVFGIVSISDIFIPLYFGEDFSPSSLILIILSISLVFSSFASVVRTQYLIPKEKDKIYIGSVVCGAVINIVANLVFIPFLGAKGAAIGTVLAEFSVAVFQMIAIGKKVNVLKDIVKCWPFVINGFYMFLIVLGINSIMDSNGIVALIIDILFGIIVYLLLSLPWVMFHFKHVKQFKV